MCCYFAILRGMIDARIISCAARLYFGWKIAKYNGKSASPLFS